MNNQERIQARIARDKARKAAKRKPLTDKYGELENVITMQNLFRSLQKRKSGVMWKGSVQRFMAHAIVKLKRLKDSTLNGKPEINTSVRKAAIRERGKRRDVCMVMIDSRVVQGAICDSSITPLMLPRLIYDNPASLPGKGVDFARQRMNEMLRRQIAESGNRFYALQFDFKFFFDSIRHSLCRDTLRAIGQGEKLQNLTMDFIKMYFDKGADTGCSLGSQISQNMAVAVPNALDHLIKDRLGTRKYIRYMDDGIILHRSKKVLIGVLRQVERLCAKIGFKLHSAKTRIIKASRGFTFLKIRYTVTDSGKIIRRTDRSGIVRMRQKLNKLKGNMTAATDSIKSWLGGCGKYTSSYRSRKAAVKLYESLFGYSAERRVRA